MKPSKINRGGKARWLANSACGLVLACALVGCAEESSTAKKEVASPAAKLEAPAKKVPVGKNVFLEIQGDKRRVLVQAYVCLREGQLEQFLTRKRMKEHEAILAADVDARDIHTALNLAGAEEGKPVRFVPKYQPASGSVIKIQLIYVDKGKKIEVPAQQWIRNVQKRKELDQDWVFGGSFLVRDPLDDTKKPYYAANDGDVICVSNFDTAMLDLPIESSQDNSDLAFEAYTERIPPLGTSVLVVLTPAAKKK
jgi:hypothetical protein